jgi:hypothetical protein
MRFIGKTFGSILAGLMLLASQSADAVTIRVSQESAAGVGDFDANVLGFVDSFDVSTLTPAGFYTFSGSSYNGGPNGGTSTRTAYFGTDGGTGNLLIVAAQISEYDREDYFKIKALAAMDVLAPPPPDTGVPAPGAMSIFGLGVIGMAALRRRMAHKGGDENAKRVSLKTLFAGLKGLVARANNAFTSANVADDALFQNAAR